MNIKAIVKKYTMVIALVVVFIFFTALTGGKLIVAQNVSNLLLQNAYVLVMACGMLLCILTGGNVDLSIGSSLCLSGALAAKLLQSGMPTPVVILASLLVGCVIGCWQGYLIGYIHIPPFICTLAGMFLFRGLSRVILDSRTISIQNKTIIGIIIAVLITLWTLRNRSVQIKNGYAADPMGLVAGKLAVIDILIVVYASKLMQYKGIPVMLIWILAVVLIFAYVTSSTVFGRYFYAVGGNEKATKLSGIDPRRVYFAAYFLMSFLAALSGLLMSARIGSVDGAMGTSYEMDAIASCFIGGASAYGGSGTVPGIMIGAILLGVINQGMSIYGLSDSWQYVVKGAVLLAAVVFDVVSNHKTGKS